MDIVSIIIEAEWVLYLYIDELFLGSQERSIRKMDYSMTTDL